MNQLTAYTLRLGDNCLVLSQRLGEWCGHAPELEIDLALANIGLDLLGQARNFLSYAAELAGEGDEDTLAFTRDERQFSNLLLVEQPNGNFADTIARQYFIDAWHVALFTRLMESRDPQLAAISAKAIKEARYHLRFSRGWLERLGNGTDVSGQKMQQAIDKLWRFTAELFDADEIDIALSEEGIAVDPRTLRAALMNPLMILVKIIKLRWIHILSYDQMVSRKINNQTTRCANSIFYTTLFTNSAPNYT
ncbi:1,2-phenylacetyl-CoA epoxidase subunit PaaC [Escherichia coli]|uniref:1,2-phenylacetyl-CoA epoxidase subunit PaaC n=2 Tax=Escherichia coli TaxID=562 RepID=UPI003A4DC83B